MTAAQGAVWRVVVTLAAFIAGLSLSVASALAAPPEKPVTKPATGVTATTATLRGELNPGKAGEPGEYDFTSKRSTSDCAPEGIILPEPPGTALGKAKEAVSVEQTDLQPNSSYTFCAVATHEGQSATGARETFKTLAARPAIAGEAASEITPFAATLEALVNPDNQETSYSFEYSPKATGEVLEAPIKILPGGPALSAEFGDQTASVPTGAALVPNTTYFYRVVAKNATGTTTGTVGQFATLSAEAPIVASESVSSVTSSDATLEAKVNPNYQETTYHFEYAPSEEALLEGKGTVLEGSPPRSPLTAVFEEQLAGPVDIGSGLTPGVTYFYRVVATNATAATEGPIQSFTALTALPVITATAAVSSTRTTALLSTSLNPHGGETTYYFAYMTEAAYEAALVSNPGNPFALAKATQAAKLSRGDEAKPVALEATDLVPASNYEFAVVALNSAGTTVGAPAAFGTALGTPPIAMTGGAEGVGQFSATITGGVDTRGLQSTLSFELGTSPNQGTLLPGTVTSSSGTVDRVRLTFSEDLAPGTTYFYRLIAVNPDGDSEGAEQSFTTVGVSSAFAAVTLPALVPYMTIALSDAKEPRVNTSIPKKPTNRQLLAKALKSCQRKPKKRRASCRRRATKRYGPRAKRTGRA